MAHPRPKSGQVNPGTGVQGVAEKFCPIGVAAVEELYHQLSQFLRSYMGQPSCWGDEVLTLLLQHIVFHLC